MAKIKDRDSAIKWFETKLRISNPEKHSEKYLVEILCLKYDADVLQELDENIITGEEVYSYAKKNILEIFDGRNQEQCKQLAIALATALEQEYTHCSINTLLRYFCAATIHICFDYLCEDGMRLQEAFNRFDIDNGKMQSFCRLVVLAKIETHWLFRSNAAKLGFCEICKNDGDAVADNKYLKKELRQTMQFLWKDWLPNKKNAILCAKLNDFLLIDYARNNSHRSPYHIIRNRMKKQKGGNNI